MRKIFVCLILTILFTAIKQTSKAQTGSGISISAGPEMGFQTDIHNPNSEFELDAGVTIKLEVPILSGLHLTLTAGYLNYENNRLTTFLGGDVITIYNYFPVKGGLRYYLPKSLKYLYVEGEAGKSFVSNSPAPSSFIYSGGFGGIIPIGARSSFDLSMRYENGYKTKTNSNFPANTIAIRFAYRYQFK
jgi:hypothetical protein